MRRSTPPEERGGDVGLQVGKRENKVRVKSEDLRDIGRREGRYPGFFLSHALGPDGISRYPYDAAFFTQQIERFDRLFGQADDAFWGKHFHGISTCEGRFKAAGGMTGGLARHRVSVFSASQGAKASVALQVRSTKARKTLPRPESGP